jgi:uncharacterized Tic20 family protein
MANKLVSDTYREELWRMIGWWFFYVCNFLGTLLIFKIYIHKQKLLDGQAKSE